MSSTTRVSPVGLGSNGILGSRFFVAGGIVFEARGLVFEALEARLSFRFRSWGTIQNNLSYFRYLQVKDTMSKHR
ncbi:hypothetical protein DY000_02024225 [Brassica cretica]|uniref:Uncharacterized protein n=1 Tax=Brassica cretica TaxID=69181 RepID=A0ABQ7EIB6_BRACR|nr:hypothetical protein DY000_02024225 [Brassica cretica]